VSGRPRPGEPACVPVVLSVVGRNALSTRQPCQPVARNQEPATVFQVYAAAARGQAEELQMWNADGTIGVSGELAGGTLIFEFCVFLKNHLCYSAACGLGSRTRRRSAVGEEGFEVEHGDCQGDCRDDNEDTNAVEPEADEKFIPFFSMGIF